MERGLEKWELAERVFTSVKSDGVGSSTDVERDCRACEVPVIVRRSGS